MSSVVISGDTSGAVTISAPAVAGTNTLTLQAGTATNSMNTLGTSITLTNQTAPDFTAIPSWVKRITLNMSGVSTNSTGTPIIQLGTGSTTYTTSGYLSSVSILGASTVVTSLATSGFAISASHTAAYLIGGNIVLTNVTGNTWACSGVSGLSNTAGTIITGGSIALGAALTAVRFYIDGTQFFDAGSINIFYEG
jgi:hypothetical protein